ncbi:MAG: hypothetical protein ACLUW6_02320 [Coriobacteriaceae bacterium]
MFSTTTVALPPAPPPSMESASAISSGSFESGMTASAPASPTPMTEGRLMMPPFAYQSTPIWGMDGGFRLKLPWMLKWGSLIFGSSSLQFEKKLAIAPRASDTMFLAPPITLSMVFFCR